MIIRFVLRLFLHFFIWYVFITGFFFIFNQTGHDTSRSIHHPRFACCISEHLINIVSFSNLDTHIHIKDTQDVNKTMIQLYIEMEVEVILAMRRIFPLLAHIKGEKFNPSVLPKKYTWHLINERLLSQLGPGGLL